MSDLAAWVDAAFEYSFPLYAVAQTRHRALHGAGMAAACAPNTLQHSRQLCDHRTRWITAPNNDTLYVNAWLDLSAGPVTVLVDAMPAGRYWSVALMDAFTNHIGVIGQRCHDTGPVTATVLGPGQQAPACTTGATGLVVQAPGHDVWLLARCRVDGPHDLAAAQAMQDRLTLQASAGPAAPGWVMPTRSTDPQNFLAVVNQALARNPAPAEEQPLLQTWAAVGLRPAVADAWQALVADARAAWSDRIEAVHAELRAASARGRRVVQGWVASAPEMGAFGANHRLRASVALGGIGALPMQEAMYFVRFADDTGQPLDGRRSYRLHVPAGGIPADAFWSFSMYDVGADGQRHFAENPLGRYAIGRHTPGLVADASGALDLHVQHEAPGNAQARAHWLPAPAGPFQIALRAYLPRAALREGRAVMPGIQRV